MRIVSRTPDRLVLHSTPLITLAIVIVGTLVVAGFGSSMAAEGRIWGWPLAIIGSLVGIAMLMTKVEHKRTVFDRTNDSLTIQRRSFLRRTEDRYPLSSVERAVLDSYVDNEGDTLNRPALRIRNAEGETLVPLVEEHNDSGFPARNVARINNWLDAES